MKRALLFILITVCYSCASHKSVVSQNWDSVELPVDQWLAKIEAEFDTDKDKKITINDDLKKLQISEHITIEGVYPISVLFQRLATAKLSKKAKVKIKREQLLENPIDRTSRLIKEKYWKSLTRSIDKNGIKKIAADPKAKKDGHLYIYVPHSDSRAYRYFKWVAKTSKDLNLKVKKLPAQITAYDVRKMDGKHGILSLQLETNRKGTYGTPFVVPGGRFNEMYGWDSYFIILGLLQDGHTDLAKEMVEKGQVEVAPLAFMRGRTLSNAFVILDEAQNTTSVQMKMLLTRIGRGSKCVITGDITQIDLPRGVGSGLTEAVRVLKDIPGISMIQFSEEDVIRHPLVSRIIQAYAKDDR